MNIGNVKLSSRFILAPMAAVNCMPFRVLCKRYGAGLIYSQMINVDGFIGNEETILERYADFVEEERPVAAQIIGAKAEKLAEAAYALQKHAEIIDINFGCSESDQLGKKAGCYFVKHPEKMYDTVKSVVDAVDVPVTAKIRIGWDDSSINCVDIAKTIEKAGALAVTVHARTRKQGFSGEAKWKHIKAVKEAIKIPVIGNGDVRTPELAKAMIDKTGCDFVMIGRAAIGDPHIFKRTTHFMKTGDSLPYQTSEERYQDFIEFLKLYELQPRQKFSEIRNHAIWLCKGLKGARSMKNNLLKCEDIDSIKKVFDERRRHNQGSKGN